MSGGSSCPRRREARRPAAPESPTRAARRPMRPPERPPRQAPHDDGIRGSSLGYALRSMAELTLTVNGTARKVDVDPATPLLYVLSDDLALKGPKFGCGLGQCGACTVLVNGRATRSCVTPVNAV